MDGDVRGQCVRLDLDIGDQVRVRDRGPSSQAIPASRRATCTLSDSMGIVT